MWRLERMVARRLSGEPLEWITGWADFCGLRIRVARGVYVPRWHTEALADRAATCLPEAGVAIDICCGSGAIAAVLSARRPQARVLATDVNPQAVACARANGSTPASATSSTGCRTTSAALSTSSPAWCPTCRRPSSGCCSATPSCSRRRWPMTVVRTDCRSCAGRSPTQPGATAGRIPPAGSRRQPGRRAGAARLRGHRRPPRRGWRCPWHRGEAGTGGRAAR